MKLDTTTHKGGEKDPTNTEVLMEQGEKVR